MQIINPCRLSPLSYVRNVLSAFMMILLFFFTGLTSVQARELFVKNFVELKVKTLFSEKILPKVSVEISTAPGAVFNTLETDESGISSFALPLDNNFIIKFSKPGYVSKIVTINTSTSDRLAGVYKLEFSITLLEQIPKMDFSVFDKPVARIVFSVFTRSFEFDQKYAASMRAVMQKLQSDYVQLLESETNSQSSDTTRDSTSFSESFRIPADSVHLPKVSTENTQMDGNIYFSVQIIVLSKPLKNYKDVFTEFGDVREYQHSADKKYKYCAGNYKSIYDAGKLLVEVRKFFPHAFIIAFRNNERVDIPDDVKVADPTPKTEVH
jgi:hypothetical protein